MADMNFDEYSAMVENTPVQTMLVEYRGADGVLCGVGLTDRLKDGLSMVYSFFEPDQHRRSLGTFIILDHIRRSASMGLDYVYLGYWIGDSAKMSYKTRFRPVEMLDRSGWRTFDPAGDHIQSQIKAEPDSEDEIAEPANWRAWRFD